MFMASKKIAVARLDLTSKQKRMVAVVLLLIPILIAVSGITIWVRQTAYAVEPLSSCSPALLYKTHLNTH